MQIILNIYIYYNGPTVNSTVGVDRAGIHGARARVWFVSQEHVCVSPKAVVVVIAAGSVHS